MLGLRMVTAKKSTNRLAVRSSAPAIIGDGRFAMGARGSAGGPCTSCCVVTDSNVLESSKSTIITTFMIVLLREVSAEGILRGGPRVSRAA